jgi:hypothetical protein
MVLMVSAGAIILSEVFVVLLLQLAMSAIAGMKNKANFLIL